MGLERFGVLRALAAISRANVACLVLDFDTGLANQDLHVSNFILDSGKGLIIAVNKTDLMDEPEEQQGKFLDLLTRRMNYVPWAPVLFISAYKRKNIFKILDIAKSIYEERSKKIPDATFKIFLEATIYSHPLTRNGIQILIEKGWQSGIAPPTFTFICPRKDMIHFSYKRFIENEIRRKFGFQGTAIKLRFQERE
jgi:GTP-binding protein